MRREEEASLTSQWEPSSVDFIHARQLFGSVPDWPFFMQQAFRTLRPGGWMESFEISVAVSCDDGSVQPGSVLAQWGSFYAAVGERTGCSFTIVDDGVLPPLMRDVGFVNVHEHRIKCPLTGWMEDKKQREIGRFNHVAVDEGLEGTSCFLPSLPLASRVVKLCVLSAKGGGKCD